jgi:D-glycero-D-manno-heptose 1,7-bisphosphate phosphatase
MCTGSYHEAARPVTTRCALVARAIHNQTGFVNIFISRPRGPDAGTSFLDLPARRDQKSPSQANFHRTDMTRIRTILLDRDGTLIEERHYLRDPDQVVLIPGVAEPMRLLAEMGCRFFLTSNQSGIGRGLLSEDDYRAVHARLEALLRAEGVILGGAAFCPHAPHDACRCRKPRTGMWQDLSRRFALLPESTVMVGDKAVDVAFGQAAGCAETALVLTGHGRDEALKLGLRPSGEDVLALPPEPGKPDVVARNLACYLNRLVQKKGLVHAHRV